MKKISLIIVAALAFAFVACAPKQISTKVLCYNTHNCVGLDGEFSCERIAKIISEVDADAVAVQELDSMTTRRGCVVGVGKAHWYARCLCSHNRLSWWKVWYRYAYQAEAIVVSSGAPALPL